MSPKPKTQSSVSRFSIWLCFCLISTVILTAIYLSAQQSARSSVDEQLSFIAASAVGKASSGQLPTEITGNYFLDIRQNDTSFLILVDSQKRVLASNAKLDGVTPLPPQEVLEQAQKNGYNSLTWEPENQLKNAIYVKPFKSDSISGYVIAGQSLQPTEVKIRNLASVVLVSWFCCVAITSLLFVNRNFWRRR